VIAHYTEQHFGSAVPPKNPRITPGGTLPHFGKHWLKHYNRVFALDSRISNHSNEKKSSTVNRTNRIFQ